MNMKKIFLILLVVCFCDVALAQTKRFEFDLGFTHPVRRLQGEPLTEHLNFYLNTTYNLKESPLSVKLQFAQEKYITKSVRTQNEYVKASSVIVSPSINYNVDVLPKLRVYGGLGTGLSIDDIYYQKQKVHPLFASQVGIKAFKHLNMSLQYHLSGKDFSRWMVCIGYVF